MKPPDVVKAIKKDPSVYYRCLDHSTTLDSGNDRDTYLDWINKSPGFWKILMSLPHMSLSRFSFTDSLSEDTTARVLAPLMLELWQ